jgi:hypothetical protein
MRDMEAERRLAIEEIFEAWDFGAIAVLDTSGWEHDGMDRFERTVFAAPDGWTGDSLRARFAVEFAHGSATDHHVEFDPPRDLDPAEPTP